MKSRQKPSPPPKFSLEIPPPSAKEEKRARKTRARFKIIEARLIRRAWGE